jgi:hypothetical protein
MFTCPEPTAVFAVFNRHAVWRLRQELAKILEPARGVEPLPYTFQISSRLSVSVQVDRIMAYIHA